ncbi:hypothetical protein FRACYDRAFT_244945 [Fragilariopsis cylindrus CCMP1102]|uniref:Uncharacterized protein n=1 Tax=Fragilariopsis cylindrus CCMP1102 TaxID=635003 RepID=A0A1E7F172_9STRA|nr:hypothetical protein FRACYDRAFT_244945 [Fragilariopsis cylindrus CCMP1102]|eukprot:OEU11825.1 hypothetical protein FRACYDRAFT_244945 [Fragilariopsis cylindrus CCMP1102]
MANQASHPCSPSSTVKTISTTMPSNNNKSVSVEIIKNSIETSKISSLRVRFHTKVKVKSTIHLKHYTNQEIEACWYTSIEYIESGLKHSTKSRRQNAIWSVLDEQYIQYEKAVLSQQRSLMYDVEKIRNVYKYHTQTSEINARVKGRIDAEESYPSSIATSTSSSTSTLGQLIESENNMNMNNTDNDNEDDDASISSYSSLETTIFYQDTNHVTDSVVEAKFGIWIKLSYDNDDATDSLRRLDATIERSKVFGFNSRVNDNATTLRN